MHKKGEYKKDSKFFFLMSGKIILKRKHQCFHSISIESTQIFDIVLIFLVRKHQILYWKIWI